MRQRDDSHLYGYGREAYFWSLLAALGLFIVGAVISVMHGIQQLFGTESSTNYGVAYVVLAVSAVLKGASLAQSIVQLRRHTSAYARNSFHYALNGSNTTLRAVLAEDTAALIGLTIAAVGIFLYEVTGVAAYDAIGSILIGLLLGIVAVVLIDRNRQYLLGSSPPHNFGARLAGLCLPDQRSNALPTYILDSPVQAACIFLRPLIFLATDQKIKSRKNCAELSERSRKVRSSRLPC